MAQATQHVDDNGAVDTKKNGRRRGVHRSTPDNVQAILQAVLEIAVRSGYEGTTMAEVARRSRLPTGSVYWHFENKETLFVALIDYCFEQWKKRHRGPSNST